MWRECGGRPQYEVSGYDHRILGGNHLSATEHRLTETRSQTAAPLPGKTLVVFNPRRCAVADIVPIEDGHAQEHSALDSLIETLQDKQLWIAGRNFCTLKFLYATANRQVAFVIRLHHRSEEFTKEQSIRRPQSQCATTAATVRRIGRANADSLGRVPPPAATDPAPFHRAVSLCRPC